MARGNIICFDSLGSSEGVGFAGSINTPGSAPTTAKFTIGTSTEGVHRRRPRGRARLRRDRHAGRRWPHPGRLLQGRAQVGTRRSARSTASAGRCRATWRASKPTARSCCSGRGSVVHQLRRREGVPRRGRGSREGALPTWPTASWSGVPDDRFGEAVTAVVACRAGATPTAARAHRRARVARALQATAPVRVRARDHARPERQGRLQVGQGPQPPTGRLNSPTERRRNAKRAARWGRPYRTQTRCDPPRYFFFPALPTLASTSRELRISTSSPSTVISVPPYFE